MDLSVIALQLRRLTDDNFKLAQISHFTGVHAALPELACLECIPQVLLKLAIVSTQGPSSPGHAHDVMPYHDF